MVKATVDDVRPSLNQLKDWIDAVCSRCGDERACMAWILQRQAIAILVVLVITMLTTLLHAAHPASDGCSYTASSALKLSMWMALSSVLSSLLLLLAVLGGLWAAAGAARRNSAIVHAFAKDILKLQLDEVGVDVGAAAQWAFRVLQPLLWANAAAACITWIAWAKMMSSMLELAAT